MLSARDKELVQRGWYAELFGRALADCGNIALATLAADLAFADQPKPPTTIDEVIDAAGEGGSGASAFNQPGDFAPEPKPPKVRNRKRRAGNRSRSRRRLAAGLRLKKKLRELALTDATLGMVKGHWHGPTPPSPAWTLVKTGPRGGKIWAPPAGGAAPKQRTGTPRRGKANPTTGPQDVVNEVRRLQQGGTWTAQDTQKLTEALLDMRVTDITAVKKALNLKASGTKAILVQKLVERAKTASPPTAGSPPAVPPPSPPPSPRQPRPAPASPPAATPQAPQPPPVPPLSPPPLSPPPPLRFMRPPVGSPPPVPTATWVVPHKDEIDWETGKPQPGTLNGVNFAPAPPKFWEKVKDVDVGEPPPLKKVDRVGIIIQEPDGRIWIVQPTNGFGRRKYTLPGGGVEPGLTDQQNALKEVWEETGLQVEITGHLGDFEDSNNGNNGRLYIGKRVGGAPWDAKIEPHIRSAKTGQPAAESEKVTLVTPDRAGSLLHRTDDLAQLMAVHPIDIKQPTRGAGSEPLKKFLAGIQPTIQVHEKKHQQARTNAGNSELQAVQNLRGFNKNPKVLKKTDFDALVAQGGHIEMLRGIMPAGRRQSAQDLADQFRTGEHFSGYGVFGSGTYCDSNKGHQNASTQYSGYGYGSTLRIALPKTAKIIKQSELEKAVKQNPAAFQGYLARGGKSPSECWQGVQAALAGYDAIEVDGNSSRHGSYGKGFYVVLNRGICAVQEEDASGHKIT